MCLLFNLSGLLPNHKQNCLVFCLEKQVKYLNPLSASRTKWSNTLKQFLGNLPNCLSVFDHFVGLVLKGLIRNDGFLGIVTISIFTLPHGTLINLDVSYFNLDHQC